MKINKLHFVALFSWQIITCFAVLLLNVLISAAVIRLTDYEGPAGTGDGIAMIWILVVGLIFFAPSFKYMLFQGISRKRFFLAGSLSMVTLAAVITVLVLVIYSINLQVANVWMVYKVIYGNHVSIGLVLWEFAAFLFLGMLGWFISLVYYVSNRIARYIVSISPIVLIILLVFFNALADGAISRTVLDFLITVMGLSSSDPNPYTGTVSMLAAAVIISGAVFLLLRRAQVND
ncbi:MAG: hypothetical protein JXA46_15655 [Dehalococcoidales bacterium]|nr:hypothetical protein [Dehalococcoidales bacterium]